MSGLGTISARSLPVGSPHEGHDLETRADALECGLRRPGHSARPSRRRRRATRTCRRVALTPHFTQMPFYSTKRKAAPSGGHTPRRRRRRPRQARPCRGQRAHAEHRGVLVRVRVRVRVKAASISAFCKERGMDKAVSDACTYTCTRLTTCTCACTTQHVYMLYMYMYMCMYMFMHVYHVVMAGGGQEMTGDHIPAKSPPCTKPL